MASVVDICNMALSRVGDSATVASIDPPEGSAQADHCARFFPQALNYCLSLHPWTFSVRRSELAELSGSPAGWAHAYSIPSDYHRLLKLFRRDVPTGSLEARLDDHWLKWDREIFEGQQVIAANEPDLDIVYQSRGTAAELWPATFVELVAWYLASLLAGPVIKGATGIQISGACLKQFELALAQAKLADAQQVRERIAFVPVGLETYNHEL